MLLKRFISWVSTVVGAALVEADEGPLSLNQSWVGNTSLATLCGLSFNSEKAVHFAFVVADGRSTRDFACWQQALWRISQEFRTCSHWVLFLSACGQWSWTCWLSVMASPWGQGQDGLQDCIWLRTGEGEFPKGKKFALTAEKRECGSWGDNQQVGIADDDIL